MNRLVLGSLLSFAIAFFGISILKYFLTVPQNVEIREVKLVVINGKISLATNIKDKVVVKKSVNNTNYLNSWKLSATVLGNTSFAMVLKGRDSKVLKISDKLEGYEVKKIDKEKVLFSTTTDDVWLYVKSKKVPTNNPGINKVAPTVGSYSIRSASFKRNVLRPERLLKTVNIMPEMQGNQFQGMKVASLLEGSFLYMYGLRKDDIIKRINGKKLLSIADGISGYQSIITSSKFSISVLRDNKIEEFKYEIVK